MQPEAPACERVTRRPAIKSVADDRMTDAGQMHANLMAAAGPRRNRQQRELADAANRLDHRRLSAAGAFEIRTRRIADDHLARVLRMMRDRPVDLDLLLDCACHQRLVAPRDPP